MVRDRSRIIADCDKTYVCDNELVRVRRPQESDGFDLGGVGNEFVGVGAPAATWA